MRIADVSDDSIVDGPGMRFVVFTQGCIRLCPECHNPQTQSMDGGRDASVDELFERVRSNPLCSGLTLSGGEPFAQPGECAELARRVRGIGKSVWCFSGYRLEELEDTANIPRTVAVKRRRRTKLDQHDPGFLDGQLVIENDLGAHVDPR
ncbi:MAG: radical SAM protein, partial [Oscillospiraceae bacterium]|nr:radical SAM protein [Oscillospiraceae bacterium]